MDLVHLLIWILVLCLIAGLIWYVIGMMPIPQPFKNVVVIVFCIILIIVLLNMMGMLGGAGFRVGDLSLYRTAVLA